ncbi:transposase, partial [Endozoicomonas sp. SESOKO3]|uniref:transposase n=1 Tax=Endozoicomonas sp. SESOKO3 TaxID=2828744 RepID=UPI0035A1BC65
MDTALQELSSAKQQLNWFKRQLFGEKSEKRFTIDNPDQMDLGEIFKTPSDVPPPETGKRSNNEETSPTCPEAFLTDFSQSAISNSGESVHLFVVRCGKSIQRKKRIILGFFLAEDTAYV